MDIFSYFTMGYVIILSIAVTKLAKRIEKLEEKEKKEEG